jgi:hypothetical protein
MKRAVILGALCATSLQAQIVIDNFDTGDFSITQPNSSQGSSNPLVQQLAESDVIGGRRMTLLYWNEPNEGSTISVSGGRLNFFQSFAAQATLIYGDTTGAEPSEQLHLNLSNTRLFFNVTRNDVHAFLGFSLYRNDGSFGSATIRIDGAKSYIYTLNDPSWSDVAGIQVTLTSPTGPNNEIDLSSIMVEVPEPSTYAAMFGIGLVGFSVLKRYHSRTA